MPHPRYRKKLTDKDIIKLFRDGVYRVDLDTGILYGPSGKEIKGHRHEGYRPNGTKVVPGCLRVRLYNNGKMRHLPISCAVWLAGARRPIPKGFEIHHRNTDTSDNRWLNLFCLFGKDHSKLHNGDLLDDDKTPF